MALGKERGKAGISVANYLGKRRQVSSFKARKGGEEHETGADPEEESKKKGLGPAFRQEE